MADAWARRSSDVKCDSQVVPPVPERVEEVEHVGRRGWRGERPRCERWRTEGDHGHG